MYQNNPFAYANPSAPYTPPQRRPANDPFAAFDDLAQQPTPERSSTVTSAQRRQREQRERVFSDIDPFATFQGAPSAKQQAQPPQQPPAPSAGFQQPSAGAAQPPPPPPPPQAAVQAEPVYLASADPGVAASQNMGQVGRAVVMDAFAATSPAKSAAGPTAGPADPFSSGPFGGPEFAGGAAAQSVPPPATNPMLDPFSADTPARAGPQRGPPSPAARTLHMAFGAEEAVPAAPAPPVAEPASDPDAVFGFGPDPNNARTAPPPHPSAPAPSGAPAPPPDQAASASSSDLFDFFSPTRPAHASPSVPVATPAPAQATAVPSPTSRGGAAPAQAAPARSPGLARQPSARQELLDTAVSLRDDGEMSYSMFQTLKRRILIGDADARVSEGGAAPQTRPRCTPHTYPDSVVTSPFPHTHPTPTLGADRLPCAPPRVAIWNRCASSSSPSATGMAPRLPSLAQAQTAAGGRPWSLDWGRPISRTLRLRAPLLVMRWCGGSRRWCSRSGSPSFSRSLATSSASLSTGGAGSTCGRVPRCPLCSRGRDLTRRPHLPSFACAIAATVAARDVPHPPLHHAQPPLDAPRHRAQRPHGVDDQGLRGQRRSSHARRLAPRPNAASTAGSQAGVHGPQGSRAVQPRPAECHQRQAG